MCLEVCRGYSGDLCVASVVSYVFLYWGGVLKLLVLGAEPPERRGVSEGSRDRQKGGLAEAALGPGATIYSHIYI